jgi:microcystin-dependent protein
MTYTANSIGGEYAHQLTVEEMPNHSHAVFIQNTTNNPQTNAPKWSVALPNSWKQYTSDTMLFGPNTNKQGGDQSHNNIQPYIVVYFWRRTA